MGSSVTSQAGEVNYFRSDRVLAKHTLKNKTLNIPEVLGAIMLLKIRGLRPKRIRL
jgi:hypothetical protein